MKNNVKKVVGNILITKHVTFAEVNGLWELTDSNGKEIAVGAGEKYQCFHNPQNLMKFDPVTGQKKPYPSAADQYRQYHGVVAWLFNPYTGTRRDPRDIGSDVQGLLIVGE